MPKQVVLLSGPVASGKTTLVQALVEKYGFHPFKTRQLIQAVKNVKRASVAPSSEQVMYLTGKPTAKWIADAIAKAIQNLRLQTRRLLAHQPEVPSAK
jgi:adenylosuccinate synthase